MNHGIDGVNRQFGAIAFNKEEKRSLVAYVPAKGERILESEEQAFLSIIRLKPCL